MIGLAFHVAAIALPGAGPQGVLGQGAPRRAVQGGRRAGRRHGDRHPASAGACSRLFPGTLARDDRLPYAAQPGQRRSPASTPTPSRGHPHVFVNALLGLFGALALMVAAIVLFQSQRAENALTGEDESAIRGLLELYGKNDSLGYFATRRDKSVVFAPNGRAAITYRVEVGVCLASGDPVGDPRAWPQAIDAWLTLCQAYGWAPGVMGASSAAAQAFREAGLNALELGDEAILYPDSFRLSGPDMKRGAPGRDPGAAGRADGADPPPPRHRPPTRWPQVIKRADAWRDTETERGFSMALGRLGDPADGDCLLVEAVRTPSGRRRRDAVAGAVGHQRRLAGPDAPLPAVPQRHHRTDGQRAVPAVRRHWHQPYFAELRDVPVGVRAGRPTRRGPGRAAVARRCWCSSRGGGSWRRCTART